MKTTITELDRYLSEGLDNKAKLAKHFKFKSIQALLSWVSRGNVPHYHQDRLDLYFEKIRRRKDGSLSTKKSKRRTME